MHLKMISITFYRDLKEHCSTITYVSACNCGKTQGRREDPYTIEQANYEFYTLMTRNCPICVKQDKIDFPIFKSSSSEIRLYINQLCLRQFTLKEYLFF